eukprot:TRINITY_DN20356_c0_g1_i1.p1 TRINITY_DN20356_c0_g1~~TRINITY_DN20356_c0_g1_i1.p1  ORF type:complete len:1596 (+),score=527.40 TRINITY_DN20356_c0_g1_i1:57-4790(+)
MTVHVTAAGVQQEKYLLLEQNFADHQKQQDGAIQSGFSIGRRIKFRHGHHLDLGAMKKAIGTVLQRSPILQCNLQERKSEKLPAPSCEMISPPYSTRYCMKRPEWDDVLIEKFLFFEEVETSCADLTVPCTSWLMKPFSFDEASPLFRFVVMRRSTHIEELLIVGHRSIVDAWSIEWIVSELVQTYEQLLSPQGAGLLRLVSQMVSEEDADTRIIESSETDEFRNAVSFWATNLSDAMPVVQVPVDRPRPQLVSMKQARYSYVLHGSTQTAKNLRRIAAGCEFGLHNILISVFVTWLSRMTAEKDVVIGLLTNLRRDGYDATVGPLTNRIPLRTDLSSADDSPTLSFREVLQRTSKAISGVMQHKHVEFEQVIDSPLMQETLKGAKTTLLGGTMQDQDADALSPLFKVMYMMDSQLTPPIKRDAAWTTVENLAVVGKALAPYDLTLRVNNRWDGGVEFVFLYNAQLFTKPFIGELMNNYTYLLKQVVERPTQGIYDYSLITPKARAILPDPTTPQDEGWPGALVHVFHKNAQRHPEQLAVSYEPGTTLSYAELDVATSKFAHSLLKNGVKKGDVIGIYGYRSPAVVVAIIGIYKAGAAYSMMDPQYPGERVVTCMKIAGIVGWVRIEDAPVEPSDVDEYITSIKPKVRMVLPEPKSEKFDTLLKDSPDTLPDVEISQDDTAVVTFTSGSTGIPKGVMGRQSSLTTFYPWLGATFDITEKDRFGMCSGIAHDPLQRDIFTPLFFGAAVFIPTQDTINTPGCLGRYMKAQNITVCCFTPALGQILVTVDEANFTMNDLRFVMFVGDMLIKRDVLRLRGFAPNCRIINMWGTTETSRAVGYFDLPPPAQGGTEEFINELKEVIPCGKGMKDCQMLLLNPAGKPAGVGEAAEIHMRSCHLAKGYLGLPKDTAAKFIKSPFTSNPTDMLYKSGDLGHYLADGTVECLGRVDDQVKIRGFRIELGEINAKLSRHEKAKENVTVVRKDAKDEKIIVSYVVPIPDALAYANESQDNMRNLSTEYRDFLKSKVPHYMVPTAIVILQKMPLTPNAKINHKALPEPPRDDSIDTMVIEGLTDAEEKVLAIWKKHLAHAVRSKEDNFFDLGGHSLSATVVTMEVNKLFGVKLPLNALFASPTLAGMAGAAQGTNGGTAGPRDFMFEAQLPSCIKRSEGAISPPSKPRGVFVTGTPGFLATFIVIDLLKRTDGPIYCLIRAPKGQGAMHEAKQRMVKMLKACLGWKDEYDSRIIPCLGDLGLPCLGLSNERWAELVDRVDLVVHSGAVVHWLLPYESMKAANVDGTLEILKLCCEGDKLKVLAFISTTNVYEAEYCKYDIIKENIELSSGKGLTGGYTQSKWVADKMVMDAAKMRGIPAMCLRPSFISGASDTGAWTTDDFLVRLMKGCVQLKAYPKVDESKGIDMSPVDWMAAASVTVCMKEESRGHHYNLVNATPVPYAAVFRLFKSLGYEMEELPYKEWRAKLLAASELGENALSAVASHFSENWDTSLRSGQVHDSSDLVAAINGAPNSEFPDMTKSLEQAVCYLVGSGFLEAPPGGLQLKANVAWSDLFKRGDVDLITRARRTTS